MTERVTGWTASMSDRTQQRLLSSLMQEVITHPHKEELLNLMVEQANDR